MSRLWSKIYMYYEYSLKVPNHEMLRCLNWVIKRVSFFGHPKAEVVTCDTQVLVEHSPAGAECNIIKGLKKWIQQ